MSGGRRENQRLRTRKDLLEAAARLMREGRTPSFDEIAEAALVSRATAYRYFPGLDALLLEAGLDIAMPSAADVFAGASDDPLARLARLDEAMAAMINANEAPLRLMLAQSLQRSVAADRDPDQPLRQNRRSPLIAEALVPAAGDFAPAELERLTKALALLFGIEAKVAFADVLGLADDDADGVRRWMIRALVDAARRD